MNRLLLVVLGLISSTSLYPFFAIQRWINPKTGQIIEEYYDLHGSTQEAMQKQRADFVWACKQDGDAGMAIIEDMLNNRAEHNLARESADLSPLRDLVTLCRQESIQAYNAEFRDITVDYSVSVAEALMNYKDHPLLHEFYASIGTSAGNVAEYTARKVLKPEYTLTPDDIAYHYRQCCEDLLLEARILHAIHTNPTKKIYRIAAGPKHFNTVNHFLHKLGWQAQAPHMSRELIVAMQSNKNLKDFIESFFDYTSACIEDYQRKYIDIIAAWGKRVEECTFRFPVNIKALYERNQEIERKQAQAKLIKRGLWIASALAGGYALYRACKVLSAQGALQKIAEYIR